MPDVPLSDAGRAQAASLADHFRPMPIVAVLSSPVQRARETAAPIAAILGLAVTLEPGLDEIDFGAWTGSAFDALDSQPEWLAWNHHRSLVAPPGGETMLAAQARAMAAMSRAGAMFAGREVVMVSHQDVLKAILANILGISLDRLDRFALDPASRSVVTLVADGAQLDSLNVTS